MKQLKSKLATLLAVPGFLVGYLSYLITGQTPAYGYQSMRRLYFFTNGAFNDWFAAIHGIFNPRYCTIQGQNILQAVGPREIHFEADHLRREGVLKMPFLLDPQVCENLRQFSLSVPALPRTRESMAPTVYDRRSLVSNIYDFDPQILLENKTIQALVTDSHLLSLAQDYLGARPVLHNVSMFWSSASFKSVDLSMSAQLYHTDLDTMRWLNFFFYLTDVGIQNGPHCFVAKSHVKKPKLVQRDGRISDEEVLKLYPREDVLELTGPTGTIIAADTKGLHKGKALEAGERLMLQIRFAVNTFGQNYPKVSINEKFSKGFLTVVSRIPSTYDSFFNGITAK